MKHRIPVLIFSLLFLGVALPAPAKDAKPFFKAEDLDIITVIGSPPAQDSAETGKDLAALHALQNTRTRQDEERILGDAKEKVWRFADVLGPDFNTKDLPEAKAFFKRVVATSRIATAPAKEHWNRTRPFIADRSLSPAIKPPTSGSWPSRHATTGTLFGLILADILPEKRQAILARANEFANNRALAGVHYPSDIAAGEKAAQAIYAKLKTVPEFQEAYGGTRSEIRSRLGLPL